jgi:hypothetical protein
VRTAPPIGTYLRPVGAQPFFCYCLRLDRVVGPEKGEWDREAWTQWQLTRFGLDRERMEPVADGHQNSHYYRDLVEVATGVWRDPHEDDWDLEPLYWREMGQRGQLDLFAAEENGG